ncbi:hypothetical protein P175DRAFT_0438991 [Aspergillus ochraceoroseus IBT 24754]|uniref:SAC3/GANP/THP3 conserved domain-containing protein n=1 Tax=Aspergillus ochraceoroseus IBT 24754 TaxID=1392256 RepID=A0A2T5LU39_9EURO|nr:uncharacterized protein P175DRAFT_0438991 [Aspergillus ochraceoroseus IBT 24754]PTU19801.1 hypothetical protein P175DRAFT_0438991 [Aspergillus ochraceoroseus IBT 24754]
MTSQASPFSALHQKDGVAGSTGRGRGGEFARSAPSQARNTNPAAPRDPKLRGRGRGAPSAIRSTRGNARGASTAANTWRGNKAEAQATATGSAGSPFAQIRQNQPSPSAALGQGAQQKPSFAGFGKASPQPFGASPAFGGTVVDASRDPRKRPLSKPMNGPSGLGVPVEETLAMNNYNERYEQLKLDRAKQRGQAIKDGQMADPNQPTSLNKAITPVGTCTSMCPEFERVERIVQKMVDKSEKFIHPATNSLQIMEAKMLKRFRRSAAGYDEQLPSDIRTPRTLLQAMNYLIRHVIGGSEPLGLIHKFVWDRTRSLRNDFSVQQLTQEEDVKIAVTCLERIARFHIVSLHLLSSPANEEPFDRHQEREQLNNTMLSLMYYYDDNRGRISFPNEDEFRAYYIIFSIHDQRPDLEARVQKWPPELRNSPRVKAALELFAAAGNTWEYQGTLDAKRPNAIAQGFYARFFRLVDSPGVSYLMACVAEIYFNHMRQTAIRSIWKGYCRYPSSQQHKNEEWTVDELTTVLYFDDDDQTVKFCEDQDLEFFENANGDLYLNWGSRPVDSIAFQPSSDHSFSETYVESKRAGRTLQAIVLGLNIRESANLGMIETSSLSPRALDTAMPGLRVPVDNDDSLFVSDDENEVSTSNFSSKEAPVTNINGAPPPGIMFGGFSQAAGETRSESGSASQAPFAQHPNETQLSGTSGPFSSFFSTSTTSNSSVAAAAPVGPSLNPFAKPFNSFPSKPSETSEQSTTPFATMNGSQPTSIFSATETFAQTRQADKGSPRPTPSTFTFPPASQPTTSQGSPTFNLTSSISQPPTTSTTSPFGVSQFSLGTKPDQPIDSTAGQSSSIFNVAKPPPATQASSSIFSFPNQSITPVGTIAQKETTTPEPPREQQPAAEPPRLFSSSLNCEKNETLSISSTFAKPSEPSKNIFQKPISPTLETSQERPSVSQTTTTGNEKTDPGTTIKAAPLLFSNANVEQPASSLPHPSAPFPELPPTIQPDIPDVDIVTEETANEEQGELSINSHHCLFKRLMFLTADNTERQASWIKALKEAAERRREVRPIASTAARKRVLEEQEPLPVESGSKALKVSGTKEAPPRKSLALSSMKPLPKLPILEVIESMTARKPIEQKSETPTPNQVDEDELLLSAARIAAESLRTGPRLLDGWSTSYEPWRSSFSPGSSVASSVAFSRSQSPQLSNVNGYDVALAPDTELGLGRTMSRTEQRIRITGGKGLAYKPLNFTPEKSKQWSTLPKK